MEVRTTALDAQVLAASQFPRLRAAKAAGTSIPAADPSQTSPPANKPVSGPGASSATSASSTSAATPISTAALLSFLKVVGAATRSTSSPSLAASPPPGSEADFLNFIRQESKRLLAAQFPGQNLDPDRVYVNQRAPDTKGLLSSQSVTQTLLQAVQDGESPTYDLSRTGLFHAQAWDEEDRVARRLHARGSSNALVEIEDHVAPKLLHDPTGGSLALRYEAHLRRTQYPLANTEELTQLRAYETQRKDDEAAVGRLLGETADIGHFARRQIQDHVWRKTGVTIDPHEIMVAAESGDGPARTRMEMTLSEAALRGPFASSTRFSLVVRAETPLIQRETLTPTFLSQLMSEQDVRADYLKARTATYALAEMAAAAGEAMASRAQQSAYSAKLKGALTSDGYQLIQRTMQSPDAPFKAGTNATLGGVTMFDGDLLRDVQVYRERDLSGATEHYVMYAPGAPDKDYYEFSNWRALNQQIGQWTRTPAGRRYLTDQLDPRNRKAAGKHFENIAQKPSNWSAQSAQWFTLHGAPTYRSQLGALEAERRRTTLLELRAALRPSLEVNASPDERKQLNSLRLAAESAQREYQSAPQPTPFAEYAHTKIQDGLNARLRERGVTQTIDPDNVEVDLGGDGQSKMSLTSLITYGYRERSGLNVEKFMTLRSTDAQDVSVLTTPEMRTYIDAQARRGYIGEKYVNDMTRAYLSAGPALDERRRRYQNAAQTSLRRDAFEAKLKAELSSSQHASLQPVIDLWSSPDTASRKAVASGNAYGVHRLTLNGKLVQGVYVLHTPGANGKQGMDLVYTPGAPDGIALRTYGQLSAAFASPDKSANQAMADYVYDRVNHKDKNEIGKLVERTRRNLSPQVHLRGDARISGNTGQEYDRSVLRLTGDVSATTSTRGEVIAEQAWKGLAYAAAAVTFPFPVAGYVAGVLYAGKRFADGVQSYADGDRVLALADFASGGMDLAGAAGDLLRMGLKGGGNWLKQIAKLRSVVARTPGTGASSALPSNTGRALVSETSAIGAAYHLRGGLPQGRQIVHTSGYMDGVVEVFTSGGASRYFARNADAYLELRPNAQLRQLGLVDPRKGERQVFFEVVEKTDQGRWTYGRHAAETTPAPAALQNVADPGRWKPAQTGDSLRRVAGTDNVPVRNVGTPDHREYAALDPTTNAVLPTRYIEVNGELLQKPGLNGYQATLSQTDIGQLTTRGFGVWDLSGKQYVKVGGKYYESFTIANGESRYIQHPTRTGDYHQIQRMFDGTWRALPKGGKGGHPVNLYNFKVNAKYGIASSERPGYNSPFDPGEYAKLLRKNKVKALISLDDNLARPGNHGQVKILDDEFHNNGIEWVLDKNHFIVDFFTSKNTPGAAQLAQTVSLMEHLRGKYPGGNIMVHCGYGDGRSGTVKSAFAMHSLFKGKGHHAKIKSDGVVPMDPQGPPVATYKLVADAVRDIRKSHPGAVERPDDIQLLNQYFEYLTA